MDRGECITILISIISLIVACRANKLSKTANKNADISNRIAKEANEISWSANDLSKGANKMSSKSISIDYDATFNDFHIQLQKNCTELFRLKNDFEKILTQDRNFLLEYVSHIKKDMIHFQTQKQFMRPSKYADHYDVLEYFCEDVKGNLDVLLEIATPYTEDRPSDIPNFLSWYTKVMNIYDRMLHDFEEKIAEVSDI